MDNLDQTIAQILAGDIDRYREIVEAYEARVRSVIVGMVPDPNQASDMTQEVFVIAYQRLGTYQTGTNFVAWLRTIARNVAQNERRRWYRRHEMEERFKADVAQRVEVHVDRLMEDLPEDLLNSLQDCVTKLQGKSKAIMDGFYFKEQPVNELDNLLQISVSSAKVILHRARAALVSCLHKNARCNV